MSTPPGPPPLATHEPPRPSAAGRYLFLFLLGLVLGVVAVVMLLRALDGRKTWQDHYPEATMHLLSAHMAQMQDTLKANRCSPTDVLPHLQALRSLGNEFEPAFADLREDQRFVAHARDFRATLDAALASPPLECRSAGDAAGRIGEACKACHQDFRG